MVRTGPLGPVDEQGRSVEVREELEPQDVAWLNAQMELADMAVRYSRDPVPAPCWRVVHY